MDKAKILTKIKDKLSDLTSTIQRREIMLVHIDHTRQEKERQLDARIVYLETDIQQLVKDLSFCN